MATPLIIAGHVYSFNSTTPIADVVVNIKNLNTGESHNGGESSYPELATNANGEWQVNLANFTNGYSNLDVIEISMVYSGEQDKIYKTLAGTNPVSSLVLQPIPEETFTYERNLDEVGDKVIIYRETRTLDADYESIDTETITRHPVEDDTYASIQIEEDEVTLEDQGVVSHGTAIGYFKVRYDISKDDRVRVPTDTDNIWVVMNKPVRYNFKNKAHHDEARLMRVTPTFVEYAAGAGATYPGAEFQTSVYKLGSDCTGNDGATDRVLTVTTSSTPQLERIYLDGLRLVVGTHYNATYNNTSLVITFIIKVWDTQTIGVDYAI